jgi:hypothetical protein
MAVSLEENNTLDSVLSCRSTTKIWATFFLGKSYAFILTKNGLGDILGDVFTNKSGRPDGKGVFGLLLFGAVKRPPGPILRSVN